MFASILATASPSIGGDTAAILLAGLSANIWKSELQTVANDTGVARSTFCIATKKKRNEQVRQQDILRLPAGTRATSSGCPCQPRPGWQGETRRRARARRLRTPWVPRAAGEPRRGQSGPGDAAVPPAHSEAWRERKVRRNKAGDELMTKARN